MFQGTQNKNHSFISVEVMVVKLPLYKFHNQLNPKGMYQMSHCGKVMTLRFSHCNFIVKNFGKSLL